LDVLNLNISMTRCDTLVSAVLGQALGVTDVGPEVVNLVSHATQECLRGLLEKLTVVAEHRKAALKVQRYDPLPPPPPFHVLAMSGFILIHT